MDTEDKPNGDGYNNDAGSGGRRDRRTVANGRPRRGARRVVGLIVVLLLVFGAAYAGAHLDQPGSGSTTSLSQSAGDGNTVVTQSETQISNVASKVGPSVVSIVSEGQSSGSGNRY